MRLALLDYSRFFAALSVVFFHFFYKGIQNGKIITVEKTWFSEVASYGHLGVQFFIIICGYVIFFSIKDKKATSFLKSRLKRLYPTYWIAIIFTSFFAYLWGQGTEMSVTLKQVIINFSMLQQFLGVPNVDGVYWTLFYEIIFYGVVFLILLFGNIKILLRFLVLWPIFIGVSNLFGYGFFIFNLYFSFFIIGAMFALLKNRNISQNITILTLLFSIFLGFFQIYQAGMAKQNDIVVVTLIYIFMLTFFLILNFDRFSNLYLPRSQDIGGMTYPIYLIHAHFGYMFLNQFATPKNQILIYSVLLIVVLFLSWFLWYIIEVKLKSFWSSFFDFLVKPLSKFEKWKSSYSEN